MGLFGLGGGWFPDNAPVAGTITGAGTAFHLAMFTGATTIADSVVEQVNTNIGIGTTGTVPAKLTIIQGALATGTPSVLSVTGGAHTTLDAGVEMVDVNYNLSRTVQFSTGAIATQRAYLIQAPTYAFVGASTITNAYGLFVTAPVAGANATITNSYSSWFAGNTGGTTETGTPSWQIRGRISNTAQWAFYASDIGTAPNSSNHIFLVAFSNNVYVNAPSTSQLVSIGVAANTHWSFSGRTTIVTPTVTTSGSLTHFTYTAPASTGQTASTEVIGFKWTTTGRQWATGAITTQREFNITAPTYSFVGASIITNAGTFVVEGPPIAGTNATISNAYALWVQSGQSRFDATVTINGTSAYQGAPLFINPSSTQRDGGGYVGLEIQASVASPFPTIFFGNNTGATRFGLISWNLSTSGNTTNTEQVQIRVNNTANLSDFRIYTNANTGTTNVALTLFINGNKNMCLGGGSTFGTSATNTLRIDNGVVAGTSPVDCFQMYSADQVAGNACLHTRTENGAVIKLYQVADANQAILVNSTGGAYDATLVDVTSVGLADPVKINDNFTDVFTLLNAIRSALLNGNVGLLKGSA